MLKKLWVKLILLAWLAILLGQLIGGGVFIGSFRKKLREDFEKNAQEQVHVLAYNIGSMVSDLNPEHLHQFIQNTAKLENVSYAVIYDSQGAVLTEVVPKGALALSQPPAFDPEALEKGQSLHYGGPAGQEILSLSSVIYRKVRFEDDEGALQQREVPIAVASMGLSLADLNHRIHDFIVFFLAVTIFLLLSTGGVVYVFLLKILGPLSHLTIEARRIGQGDLKNPIPYSGEDELGVLSSSFEQMRRNLGNVVRNIHSMSAKVLSSSSNVSGLTQAINTASDEVAGVVQEIARGSSRVAQEAADTFEIMKKMAVEVEQVADRSQKANAATTEANRRAEEGGTSASDAIRKINHVNEMVTRSAEVVRGLGRRSDQIMTIVEVMKEIADQTNLLALNAAIEAARAGNEGRGFSVVAEEIRQLADKSTKYSKEISELIEVTRDDTQAAVQSIMHSSMEMAQGREIVERAGDSLQEIAKAAQQMASEVVHISQTAKKMHEKSAEVMKRMQEVAAIAQESAAATQQAASSSQQTNASMSEVSAAAVVLKELADELKSIAGQFRVAGPSG